MLINTARTERDEDYQYADIEVYKREKHLRTKSCAHAKVKGNDPYRLTPPVYYWRGKSTYLNVCEIRGRA
jgi:hypothetical protein